MRSVGSVGVEMGDGGGRDGRKKGVKKVERAAGR